MMKNKKIKQVSLVMVGISGMGYYYVKTILEEFSPDLIKIQAAVDPYPEKSELYQELKDQKIPIFSSQHAVCLQKMEQSFYFMHLIQLSRTLARCFLLIYLK